MTARRMEAVEASKLLDLIVQGQELKRRGVPFVDMGPGQPDFPVPGPILEATERALREGYTYYSPVMGLPALREAVADRYNRLYGGKYTAANVLITAGAKGALYHVIGSHMDAGEEVLVPVPYYVSTPQIVRLWGGTPRLVPCRFENGFLPEVEALEAASGPRTRGIVLNSPCNPTGAVVPRDLLEKIVAFAEGRGMFIILDECYDRYVYEEGLYATSAHLDPEARRPVFCAGSFSKTFSMTGYRLGWALGPAEGISAAGRIQAHSMNGATTFAQMGGLEALRREEELFGPVLRDYSVRRDALYQGLLSLPGIEALRPDGAFYIFPRVTGLMERLGADTSDLLATRLLDEAGVMAIPGSALGLEGFMRFSFAVPVPRIREAVGRILGLLERTGMP
ncbi:MAG: pyridoxal phosphate-dependent aminotransferase [Acidobacteriota bacterium]